ncbi:derlin-1-like [Paramacrobiotus metropolitanus]|uniref:derlin-1-like n=1 Tax=Paramacrobiotus metropolitanus TaxID=2943436 RepID=UPI00244575B7|nr:derlin-1-like [Paramacrobiotus metropolitanus]
MATNELSLWYHSIPQMTKYWFTGSVVLPLLGRFGLINPQYLFLDFAATFRHFQLWRPITALFYFPISPRTGFHYLLNLYFLYNYSSQLESGHFVGRPADYLFMLIFNWACLVLIGLFADLGFLMDPMVLSVLYVWCQLNRDVIVNFWFGTRFKALYLPWVLFGFNFILGAGGVFDLLGILVGHLYYFLTFKYPQDMGGPSLIGTPSFLYRWFPNTRVMGGFGAPPPARPRADAPADDNNAGAVPRPRNWGAGRRLND